MRSDWRQTSGCPVEGLPQEERQNPDRVAWLHKWERNIRKLSSTCVKELQLARPSCIRFFGFDFGQMRAKNRITQAANELKVTDDGYRAGIEGYSCRLEFCVRVYQKR